MLLLHVQSDPDFPEENFTRYMKLMVYHPDLLGKPLSIRMQSISVNRGPTVIDQNETIVLFKNLK